MVAVSKHVEQKRGGRGTVPSWIMTDNAKEKLKKVRFIFHQTNMGKLRPTRG